MKSLDSNGNDKRSISDPRIIKLHPWMADLVCSYILSPTIYRLSGISCITYTHNDSRLEITNVGSISSNITSCLFI